MAKEWCGASGGPAGAEMPGTNAGLLGDLGQVVSPLRAGSAGSEEGSESFPARCPAGEGRLRSARWHRVLPG